MREVALAGDSRSRGPSRGGLGLDRRHQPEARRHDRRAGRRHLHACASSRPTTGTWMTARWQRSRSPRRWRRARRSTCRSPGRRGCRARSRARARSATTTFSPVVSQDWRLRGHRLELPPVPRRDGVLRGLRHLRRPADRPERLGRGRHRNRARPAGRGRPYDDASLLCGGRPRFRLDDQPRLRRAHRAVRPRRPAGGGDAPAAAARARPPGRAALQRDARRAPLLRRMVRSVSLREYHGDRSRLAERRRRHGVSDALHRRHAMAGAARRWRSRRASRCTKPAISSGTASSRPTSSSTRGWTRASIRSRPRGRSSSSSARSTTRSGTSAGSCPGCSTTCRSAARPTATGSAATATPPTPTCSRRRRGATGRATASAITYNKTALWLNTLERMLGWETLQKILSTYFKRYSFEHPSRGTSSPSPTR